MKILLLATGSLLIVLLQAIVLVNAAGTYNRNLPVPVYVNKVGPFYNIHETYHYYELPVCRPQAIVHKSMSLGELLDGDRMALSMYDVRFQIDQKDQLLCKKQFTLNEINRLRDAVEDLYYFEFVIDEIPVRGFLGKLHESGFVPHTHKVYLWTHITFRILHTNDRIVYVKIVTDDRPPLDLDTLAENTEVSFTSVKWIRSDVKFEDREKLIKDTAFFPKSLEIHWLSVINSIILVLLLVAFVGVILLRILRTDFARYNADDEEAEENAENGWKIVHSDVFRPPHHKCFFSAIIGCGFQFLTIITGLFIMALLGMFNVHHHGNINAAGVVLYALTSCIAGFVSCRIFRQFNGERWARNVLLTSILFVLPLFIIWAIVNSVAWAYGTTQALPWSTVILLMCLWLLLGLPLTIIGGCIGKSAPAGMDAPCRTKNICREIPATEFYKSWPIHCIVGGFLSFSAISVELYYIYATVWGRQHYSLYGILVIVYILLLLVTACVSVSLTYFQLSAEDYRWWWRSILNGGSCSFFVLAYSVYYYLYRTSMSGLLQSVEFFGYTLLLCYAFFLTLGSVSFIASFRFVRYIYTNVKMD